MTIALAFDCSGAQIAVAIAVTVAGQAPRILAHRTEPLERGHAVRLLPILDQALQRAEMPMAAIDMLAVTVGPGSFTGVRIGLATARGLALATGKPLAGYSTLAVLLAAAEQRTDRAVSGTIAAIDTKRGDAYIAAGGELFLGNAVMLAARLPAIGTCLVGDKASELQAELSTLGVVVSVDTEVRMPDAKILVGMALHDGVETWAERNRHEGLPRPLYLRAADVTLPDGTRTTA